MRTLAILTIAGLFVAACEGGYGPDYSRQLLEGGLRDYYYGDKGDPTENDPDFTYGWDIDGS